MDEKRHIQMLSETQFERLFIKCRPMYISIANSYVHDTEMAQDLVHDSFVRLWEKREELHTENCEAYMFRIVTNKCLDFLKSEKTQTNIRKNIHNASYRMLLHEINSLESSDPNSLYAREIGGLIKNCIDTMPEMTRRIFLSNRFEDKTYREIAEELGLPTRRVTAEIQKALHTLRSSLKDYLPTILLLLLFGDVQ